MGNLAPAVYTCASQLKILTSACFAVVLLRRALSAQQWFALALLGAGVALVELQASPSAHGSAHEAIDHSKTLYGLIAVTSQCLLSGFATTLFERKLKQSKPTAAPTVALSPAVESLSRSIWIRNIQLSGFGVLMAFALAMVTTGPFGFFEGLSGFACLVLAQQVMGGLLVAMAIKHADNVAKNFAVRRAMVWRGADLGRTR